MQSQTFESEFKPESTQRSTQSSVVKRLLAASIMMMSTIAAEAHLISVQAASLTSWNFDPAANQLEITVKDGTTPRYFLMAQPARIVVDLPDTAIGAVSAQKTYSGAVRQIRVSQFEPGLTRIVMEISPGVSLAPGQVKLQKVGNDAARAGNTRWMLQPLVTKSLSANAVAVKPSTSVQPRTSVTAPTESAAKPATARLTPIASTATVPGAAVTKAPIAKSQPAAASNIPSQPTASSQFSTATNPTTAGRANSKPSVVVPNLTAPPTTPVALAPALPPSPTPATQAGTQAETPLSPVAAPPIDPNVAVDTQSGVTIAVPTPTTRSSTATPPFNKTALQPSVPTPTKPVEPIPQSAADPTPRSAAASVPRSATSLSSTPAVKPPAKVTSRSTPQIMTTQAAPTLSLSPLEIPTTLAAASLAPTPSVSVPPLSAPGVSPSPAPAQFRQPDAPIEAPPDSVPASSSFNVQPSSKAQPSVSVPPLIRVGSPSLGLPTRVAPAVEPTPPTSVFAPNATLTPPVEVLPLLQQTPPTIVQPAVVQPSYDANTVRQPTSSANLAPPLNIVPLQAPLQSPTTTVSVTPGYDATTVRQPPTDPAPTSVVDFGQPLPPTSRTAGVGQPLNSLPNASAGVRQAFKPAAPNVLLPAGSTLNLRYPGNSTLTLKAESPQQEILVLLTELRDVSGNLLAPAGSTVTGRFETTASGSQFVTQAIVVAGRTVPLAAQSEALDGARKVEGNNLARNSGIGVLAGGVLGALSGSVGLGALGGAAAGAATTLLTAPKPAIIQPGQIVQVRLTQDLVTAQPHTR
ncbi:AMIN domain-containing protein [Stenomitos frigidus]|uniref:AMIN domain-containing protein n=1 Tax=Stenomitos frigidus ULC18 TaxID=2107698 RepID=A0A2T1EAQ9_9CYAN|nr:AMIN domain-containing protein [Stenomitos frigidus]PSB29798.1 hypothetical protein C7B82_10600 [Stenomitos frigidus ULC18]